MLDAATGELVLGSTGVRLGPSCTRTAFLNSSLGRRAEPKQTNEPWARYGLVFALGEAAPFPVAVDLQFHGEALRSLMIMNVSVEFGRGWDDWSQQKELARLAAHDRWLSASGAAAGRYPWGQVLSAYVDKSALSMIELSYAVAPAAG